MTSNSLLRCVCVCELLFIQRYSAFVNAYHYNLSLIMNSTWTVALFAIFKKQTLHFYTNIWCRSRFCLTMIAKTCNSFSACVKKHDPQIFSPQFIPPLRSPLSQLESH